MANLETYYTYDVFVNNKRVSAVKKGNTDSNTDVKRLKVNGYDVIHKFVPDKYEFNLDSSILLNFDISHIVDYSCGSNIDYCRIYCNSGGYKNPVVIVSGSKQGFRIPFYVTYLRVRVWIKYPTKIIDHDPNYSDVYYRTSELSNYYENFPDANANVNSGNDGIIQLNHAESHAWLVNEDVDSSVYEAYAYLGLDKFVEKFIRVYLQVEQFSVRPNDCDNWHTLSVNDFKRKAYIVHTNSSRYQFVASCSFTETFAEKMRQEY